MFILKNEKNLMQSLKCVTMSAIRVVDVVVDVVVDRAVGAFAATRLVLLTLLVHFSSWTANRRSAMWVALLPTALKQENLSPR